MKIQEFCKTANQTEMINLFDNLSKSVVRQHRKVLKSSEKELMTKVANKKQMDTLYANSFNDIRVYNTLLNDLKILVKYMI
jgi:16S rRNA A1518/A1519 N6-dimethyltransferase RsmA/KsgA/DIM1 with predicted DNA glycosylase/AP lyase activity